MNHRPDFNKLVEKVLDYLHRDSEVDKLKLHEPTFRSVPSAARVHEALMARGRALGELKAAMDIDPEHELPTYDQWLEGQR